MASVALVLIATLSGCASIGGTFVKPPPKDGDLVYVGTRGRLNQLTFQEETDGIGGLALVIAWPLIAIDLPLCVVADTLFLPYTIPASSSARQK
jgi:uncharacterized protein YceK